MNRWVFSLVPLCQGCGVSEEHVHAGVVGEALVVGHFWALVPGQRVDRSIGKALVVAG